MIVRFYFCFAVSHGAHRLYQCTQNLGTIQHANETRSWHHFLSDRWKRGHKSASIVQLSENTKKKLYVNFFFFFNSGRALYK